jgi:hypothetical protein
MTTRTLLAGVLGAIAMFIWTTLAHTVLPLGTIGVREMRNESPVIDALRANVGRGEGIYIFPGAGLGDNPTREAKQQAMSRMSEKLANSPSGFLVYHPRRPFNFAAAMGVEFLTELAEALLAVFLLSQTRLVTFGTRVGFVTLAGILAAIATNVSYWNWYGFSKRYTAAYMFTEIIGFFLVGLVAAFILRTSELRRQSER